jgi:hypothetical protein
MNEKQKFWVLLTLLVLSIALLFYVNHTNSQLFVG